MPAKRGVHSQGQAEGERAPCRDASAWPARRRPGGLLHSRTEPIGSSRERPSSALALAARARDGSSVRLVDRRADAPSSQAVARRVRWCRGWSPCSRQGRWCPALRGRGSPWSSVGPRVCGPVGQRGARSASSADACAAPRCAHRGPALQAATPPRPRILRGAPPPAARCSRSARAGNPKKRAKCRGRSRRAPELLLESREAAVPFEEGVECRWVCSWHGWAYQSFAAPRSSLGVTEERTRSWCSGLLPVEPDAFGEGVLLQALALVEPRLDPEPGGVRGYGLTTYLAFPL